MDCVLSLGTRKLVDAIIGDNEEADRIARERLTALDAQERRDLLMLAFAYDHSNKTTRTIRCRRLGQLLRYPNLFRRLSAKKEAAMAVFLTLIIIFGWFWLGKWFAFATVGWLLLVPISMVFVAWLPYLYRWRWGRTLAAQISRSVRVVSHDANELRRLILRLGRRDLAKQPVDRFDNDNARYELLQKLIDVAKKFGFAGVVVVVDRVDEPDRIKGDTDRMFQFMRSIFDLKFLKHPRLGVKLLLPAELHRPIQKQIDENVARLDKQNFIRSLVWSGASLHDVINARLKACAASGDQKPSLRNLLDDAINDTDVMSCLEKLKIPRHAFRFMDRMIGKHCQRHTDEQPVWKISRDTFVESRTDYFRVLEDYERGLSE